MLIERIASDAVLDEAYAWLCHRRRDYPANADIWPFRPNWNVEKRRIQEHLLTNSHRFEPLDRVCLNDAFARPQKTLCKMYETAVRLYEQKGRRNQPTPLEQYLTRWNAWFRGGLQGIKLHGGFHAVTERGHAAQGRQQ